MPRNSALRIIASSAERAARLRVRKRSLALSPTKSTGERIPESSWYPTDESLSTRRSKEAMTRDKQC